MAPHLVRWHKDLSEKGLVIIEVNDGTIDTVNAIRDHVEHQKTRIATLYDSDGSVCDAYGVSSYPTAVLIGRDGNILWDGHPSLDPEAARRRIENALNADAS